MSIVYFINTLPVPAASRHSRESGNPGDERHGDWMPACAGMTFYWRRTYETDSQGLLQRSGGKAGLAKGW